MMWSGSTRRTRLVLGGLALVAGTVVVMPQSIARAGTSTTYRTYAVGIDGGEPSIGFDTKHNAAIYGSGLSVDRLTFDDTVVPPTMTAKDVTPVTGSVITLDAITMVDQHTGRTYSSQLAGLCSIASYSDDAGSTWTPSQGCGENTVLDHQSLGAGPVHAPVPANPTSPEAVYYCSQNGFNGSCAASLDGGATFGPGVYAYNTPANDPNDASQTLIAEGGACSALHGHLEVGPDGTAYLPIKGCGGTPSIENGTNTEYVGGRPALSISTNNGLTWTVHTIPAGRVSDGHGGFNLVSNPDESDSSLGISKAGGVLYYTWENGTNPSDVKNTDYRQTMVAVSHDNGSTWSTPVDLSSPLGLNNVMFPVATAGDDDRAAVAFLATTAIGDTQTNAFRGDWHLYVSMTYDGGATWTTTDATPTKPMQRGCIDMQGTTIPPSSRADVCSQRNLLDFNDITVDPQGRVLVAYADGCTGDCADNPNSGSKDAADMVARLDNGPGLYKAFDGVLPGSGPGAVVPETPWTLLLPFAALGTVAAARMRSRRRRRVA